MERLYMIRAFGSGTDFTPQLVLALLAIGLAGYDAKRRRRPDYLWLLGVSALVWTSVETIAQFGGIRVIPDRTLLGVPLPRLLSLPIQGMGESSGFAVLGLFLADRLREPEHRTNALVGLVAACAVLALPVMIKALVAPEATGTITSRRDMFAAGALAFFSILMAIDAAFLLRWPAQRARALTMMAVLVFLITVWNLAEFVAGARWIEVTDASGTFLRAAAPLQAIGIAFDATVEFAFPYAAFLAIPTMAGVIPRET